jgi:hypothetical protein
MAFDVKAHKSAVFTAGGAAGLLLFLYWRHRQNAAQTAPGAAQSAYQPSDGISPADASGTDYGGAYGGGGSGSGGGYYDQYGNWVPSGTTGTGTGGPGSFTSNAQWAQYAESQLSGIVNEPTLSAALGKYLTGQPMTPDQKSLADQAIAIAGYPPVSGPGGFPPAMHTGGGGGHGQGGGKRFITADGKDDLRQLALEAGITEAALVSLNPGLKHFEGTRKSVPKGTRVRVS